MKEFGIDTHERSTKPGLRDRRRKFGGGCIATVAATTVLLIGCSGGKEPTISGDHLWKLQNVAGFCLFDGIKVRASNPNPDADGEPSDLERNWGKQIHVFDTDGDIENGVRISPKSEVSKNPNQVVCFDTDDGEVPFVVTERPDATPRYWYTVSLEEINHTVGKEHNFATKALIQAAQDSGLDKVVIASDGVSVASRLGEELEVVRA